MTADPRFQPGVLSEFAAALFAAAGMDADKADIVARYLVEADLMGHTTHGLALAPGYLDQIASGRMALTGEPHVVADGGAVVTWDGRTLPGVWLTVKAIELASHRASHHGVGIVAIRCSHHIACLAAFLPLATDDDKMIILATSDPAGRSVAPFGGRKPVFTPDPIAIGIPTPGDPMLIDISASITTNGMSARLKAEGKRMPHPWLLTPGGEPTDDPAVVFADPPGSILPTGGLDHGHNGFGLALMIEALTQALSGHGRADAPEGWGASVFVQVMDPAAFGGVDAYLRQTGWLADACRSNPPRPGVEKVRLPGDSAMARRRDGNANGVALYRGILDGLKARAATLGVPVPAALA
ncbi:MAG: Ldh family oxidoreductase [Alphaproteobacteria bacterium]